MRLLSALIFAGATLMAAGLGDVKTVYLMPMASGLDQHLAVALTTTGAFQVSTDPRAADAVFTDHIGAGFERSLDDLYKPDAKSESKPGSNTDAKGAAKKDDKTDDGYVRPPAVPLSRSKGNIFLVDRKTHVVLWSMYATPKSTQSEDLNELAGRIAVKIQKDRKAK